MLFTLFKDSEILFLHLKIHVFWLLHVQTCAETNTVLHLVLQTISKAKFVIFI